MISVFKQGQAINQRFYLEVLRLVRVAVSRNDLNTGNTLKETSSYNSASIHLDDFML